MISILLDILRNVPTFLLLCLIPCCFVAVGSIRYYISSCEADDEAVLKFLHSLKPPLQWFANSPSEILSILADGRNVGKRWYLLERVVFSIPPMLAISSYAQEIFVQTGVSTQQISTIVLFTVCSLTTLSAWLLGRSIVRFDREVKQEHLQ